MENETKKILIITYYWPPSGGGGVQRWLKFSKYLPEFGWEPIVFTPENPDFDLKDESLFKDISQQLEVLKFPIWEPYSIFKKLSGTKELKQGQVLEGGKKGHFSKLAVWIRGNLFIPDPRLFWAKPSAQYLGSILETNGIKTIVTTGPPHSMHLVGLKMKMANPALTWIADFRDPWSQWDILPKLKVGKFALAQHKKMEQKVIRAADCVLTVSPSWKKDFERLGARRVRVVTNGYDHQDFPSIESITDLNDKFRISHVGMLNSMRNPLWFWQILNDLAGDEQFRKDLELEFVGILSVETLKAFQDLKNLNDSLVQDNYLSHSEVLKRYQKSSVLLLLQNDSENAKGHLPGKLFEYLGAQRPILCIGNKKSDLAEILDRTSAGKVFDAESEAELKQFIEAAYRNWKEGKVALASEGVEAFSRKELTGQLVSILESLGSR